MPLEFTQSRNHLQSETQHLLSIPLTQPTRCVRLTFLKRLDFCLKKLGMNLKIDGKSCLASRPSSSQHALTLTDLKDLLLYPSSIVALSGFTFLHFPGTEQVFTNLKPNFRPSKLSNGSKAASMLLLGPYLGDKPLFTEGGNNHSWGFIYLFIYFVCVCVCEERWRLTGSFGWPGTHSIA